MRTPVHSPRLPGDIDAAQAVLVTLTRLDFFWTDPMAEEENCPSHSMTLNVCKCYFLQSEERLADVNIMTFTLYSVLSTMYNTLPNTPSSSWTVEAFQSHHSRSGEVGLAALALGTSVTQWILLDLSEQQAPRCAPVRRRCWRAMAPDLAELVLWGHRGTEHSGRKPLNYEKGCVISYDSKLLSFHCMSSYLATLWFSIHLSGSSPRVGADSISCTVSCFQLDTHRGAKDLME